ncbi:MAG: hypothetical protein Q7S46_12860 [Gallionella sp.]|nr:hypothetical protein [Gallionella sp.]
MDIIETMLLRVLFSFLIIGSFAGLFVGAILILRPHWLERMSLISNRWISTRHIDKSLERAINIDPLFYRYHRANGAFALVGALYILYFFSVQIDKASAIAGLTNRFHMPPAYIGALFEQMVLIELLGATFALIISLFVLFFPSLLRKFEHGANKWVSLRRALKPIEVLHNGVDEFTFRHTQQIGVMLILGSVCMMALLTLWAR